MKAFPIYINSYITEIMDEIKQFLIANNWSYNEDTQVFTTTFERPGATVVINGQQMQQRGSTMTAEIKYEGTGSFYNVGDEEETLYCYKIGEDTIMVLDLDDFAKWYTRYFKNM